MKSVKVKGKNISLLKTISFLLVICFACSCAEQQAIKKIPLIYSSDLYHPHGDPDDHYDLAMLNALDAFEVKAHIFDLSIPGRNPEEYGLTPLRQMAAIANKPLPPYAAGLRDALTSPDDKGENQPEAYQKGVELVLKTLRESDEKVTLFLVGSCRDFAAAYNREPELLKQKVAAVYVNAGNGPDGIQVEWNVFADPQAYVCLMNSGLPIYWSPCFSKEERTATPQEVAEKSMQAFNTYFIVPNQAELLKNTSAQVKNFFTYALSQSQEEPLQYLNRSTENLPETPRSMWCTAPFLHAAGWKIYTYNNRYIACPPEKAKTLGIADKEVAVYEYKNILLTSTTTEQANSEQFGFAKGHNLPVLKGVLTDSDAPVKVFRYIHPEYNEIMVSALSSILQTINTNNYE
ncbi:hypothetical protein FACS189451_04190 [Bacteroidia bacterium]|nr:hypothetical protein FACS189451_04190 [Bacteroidia bacterium]